MIRQPERHATERRKLTVREAADWVLQSLTREYRRECIDHWRREYGDEYADAVQREVEARWGKRK